MELRVSFDKDAIVELLVETLEKINVPLAIEMLRAGGGPPNQSVCR